MAMKVLDLFKAIIVVQLFYAVSITILTYALPADALTYATAFSDPATDINLESVGEEIQGSIEQQTNIPVIELGALVFYSGNILIDLLLNFAFAIPQMLGMLMAGIGMLLGGLDVTIIASFELFFAVLIMAMYFISIIQLLIGVRSGRIV